METVSKFYPTKEEIEHNNERVDDIYNTLESLVEIELANNEYYSVELSDYDDWVFANLMSRFGKKYRDNPQRTVSYNRKGGENGVKVEISFRIINTVIREERKAKEEEIKEELKKKQQKNKKV